MPLLSKIPPESIFTSPWIHADVPVHVPFGVGALASYYYVIDMQPNMEDIL